MKPALSPKSRLLLASLGLLPDRYWAASRDLELFGELQSAVGLSDHHLYEAELIFEPDAGESIDSHVVRPILMVKQGGAPHAGEAIDFWLSLHPECSRSTLMAAKIENLRSFAPAAVHNRPKGPFLISGRFEGDVDNDMTLLVNCNTPKEAADQLRSTLLSQYPASEQSDLEASELIVVDCRTLSAVIESTITPGA